MSRLAVALLLGGAAIASSAAPAMAAGTKLTLRDSDYGRMLWGPERQAVYFFENDESGEPTCYGKCAKDWPPVFTREKPVAGRRVREELLGTTRRRSGRKQVTYGGKPLYYYAHEGRGEVLCHDVFLNGGYWWVIGRNGNSRP